VNPLVVEFLGARGAGKSTFVSLVRCELENRNVAFDQLVRLRFRDKLLIELSCLLARWRLGFAFLSWRPASLADLRTFRKRFRKFQVRMRRYANGSGIYLVDEGVFHLIAMLHAKSAQKDMAVISSSLRRWVPIPDVVIFVRASDEAIEARRKKRGNAGDRVRPRVSPAGREARTRLEDLLGALSTSGEICLIVVDNDDLDTAKRVATGVAAQIIQRCRETTAAVHPSPVSR
jgi:hypothetical protein